MDLVSNVRMGNVLDSTKQQIVALGRVGWTVSLIAGATEIGARRPRGISAPRACRSAGATGPAKHPQRRPFLPEVSTDSGPSSSGSSAACQGGSGRGAATSSRQYRLGRAAPPSKDEFIVPMTWWPSLPHENEKFIIRKPPARTVNPTVALVESPSLAPSRACPQMRTSELAHQGPHRLAHGGVHEVKLHESRLPARNGGA